MTIMTHPAYSAVIHDQAIVRALNSITLTQADAVTDIARASGQEWDVQAVDDYDGYRSILIDAIANGDKQKAFYIAGTAQLLELFEMHDDDLALIGAFADIEALGARLTGLVGPQ